MNMATLCDIVSCSLKKYTNVSEVRTASIIALVLEAVRIVETPVYFKETTRHCSRSEDYLLSLHSLPLEPEISHSLRYFAGIFEGGGAEENY
jgi:hypothetical protein